MKFLIDTHVFLWLVADTKKIPSALLKKLQSPSQTLFLSAASVWEISIKYRLKKLKLPQDPEKFISEHARKNSIEFLPISFRHASGSHRLPGIHKDPFDRMLVTQAIQDKLSLVSSDRLLRKYKGVKLVWD